MYNPIRIHRVSFKHAFDGIVHTITTQPNFRFHLLAMICVIMLGINFSISVAEWLILVFTFNMVLVAEMINTSVESIVDLITIERHQYAKTAKDTAAGTVLVSAILAIVVGIIIFIPKIITTI